MRLACLALLVLLVTCATTYADDGAIRAAYVHGVTSIKSSIHEKANWWPWELPKEEKSKKGRGTLESIMVSNACGFGEGTYEGCMSPAETECTHPIKAKFLKGEWCHVEEYIYDEPTLLILKEWKKSFYIVGSAPLYSGDGGGYFLVDIGFIREWGLDTMAEDITNKKICLQREYLSNLQQERLLMDGNSVTSDQEICFKMGMSAQSAIKKFSSKSLQPIAPKDGAPAD